MAWAAFRTQAAHRAGTGAVTDVSRHTVTGAPGSDEEEGPVPTRSDLSGLSSSASTSPFHVPRHHLKCLFFAVKFSTPAVFSEPSHAHTIPKPYHSKHLSIIRFFLTRYSQMNLCW